MDLCQVCRNKEFSSVGSKDSYNVIKCSECELYRLDPLPSLEARIKFYNGESNFNYYQSKLNRKIKRGKSKIKSLQKHLVQKDKVTFLDIGCSIGGYVGAALELGLESHGIDLSEESIKRARRNFPQAKFSAESVNTWADKGEFKYDIIICRDIIEHVVDLNEFMAATSSLLKPRGVLYITTPDAGHYRVPKDFVTWRHVHTPDHVFYFNKKNLVSLMNKYNIQKKKISFTTRTTIDFVGTKV